MALKLALFLLLWNLALFSHGVVSSFKVTCSTDYNVSLNCSCSDAVQAQPVFLHVSCRDQGDEVNDSCEVKPSESWCVMFPFGFELFTSTSTMCTAQVLDEDGARISGSESSSWALCDVVKPEPPSQVQVTNMDDFYNITWDHSNQQDCLTYMVRIREANGFSEEPVYSLPSQGKRLQLDHERLQPQVNYTVDVKAKMCFNNLYKGPWSEWSPTVHFRSTRTAGIIYSDTLNWHFFYIPPSVLAFVVLVFLVLLYWIRKREIMQIPKPDYFFAPLYRNYGGNFKEWVNPVFRECDYAIISPQVPMKSEHDVIQLNSEKQSCVENKEGKQNGHLFHELQAQDGSLLPCQDGGSDSSSDQIGRISIHTVTLSEEEVFEEEGASQSSGCVLRRDRERFEFFGAAMEEQAGYGLEEAERGLLLQHQADRRASAGDNQVPLHIQLFEEERASLNSLTLNEQSDDGYPHVDLDTIDSGFGEYNSPGASQGAQQTFSLHEQINFHSNYVKQWMV
ncbi:interleukin 21 receptor, tandem duplicate 1 isoform X2 [Takifugu rubripes]|uniref:Interleukin-21 receptor-like n=1 Tax=Takifugu rubripes TaxID=31033 RepID=H2SF58_TAKRU|nr:interleukin-21 receptor-like isoform X2 [Takifugu rubripes]